MNNDDLHERWLEANANAPYMASVLADLVRRSCAPASIATEARNTEAMEALKLFLGPVSRSEGVILASGWRDSTARQER